MAQGRVPFPICTFGISDATNIIITTILYYSYFRNNVYCLFLSSTTIGVSKTKLVFRYFSFYCIVMTTLCCEVHDIAGRNSCMFRSVHWRNTIGSCVWQSAMQVQALQSAAGEWISSSETHQTMIRYLATIRGALSMITRAYAATWCTTRTCGSVRIYWSHTDTTYTIAWFTGIARIRGLRTNVCTPMFTILSLSLSLAQSLWPTEFPVGGLMFRDKF